MAPPIRQTHFVPEWIDMKPRIPVPRIDWIQDKKLDIAYGDDPKQKYDLYYPAQKRGPLPVFIVVHGGGFTHMDKRDWHLYPGFFALREGFALVSVNYRLAPKNPYPDGINDTRDAILHLKAHADEYGLDPDRMFLFGTSAGGNFVSILGLKAHNEGAPCAVRAVAALCPLVSMEWYMQKTLDMPKLSLWRFVVRRSGKGYLGGFPPDKQVEERMRLSSAENYVGETIPPFYLQQGTEDPAIPTEDVVRFYELLKKAKNATPDNLVLDLLEGAVHAGGGPDFLEERNILPVIEFFKRQM